jgi:hypothetical protein
MLLRTSSTSSPVRSWPRHAVAHSLLKQPQPPAPRRRQHQPAAPGSTAAPLDLAGSSVLQATLPCGQLFVVPVGADQVRAACLLVTRVFNGMDVPERFGLDDAMPIASAVVAGTAEGKGLVLAAHLVPDDPSLLPPGQSSRLVRRRCSPPRARAR